MTNSYRDDVTALATLGRPPHQKGDSASAFQPGTFTRFAELDEGGRRLVLHLLDHPREEDWQMLAQRVDGKAIAEWMLTLPVYTTAAKRDSSGSGVAPAGVVCEAGSA
jgi:hypothetical protein